MSLLLLNEDELRQTINLSEAVSVIEAAFVAAGQGRINVPGTFALNFPDVQGDVEVKGTYLQKAPFYVIKIGNHFHNNPGLNLPAHSELITVFDATTGFPAAILLDNGYLANVRTGIAGALATEYLANKQGTAVALIGSGRQAFVQAKALFAVRTVEHVMVWGQTPHEADTFARRLVEDHNVNVEIAPSVAAAVAGADVVITASAGRHPLIRANWLKPGAHITVVGNRHAQTHHLHPSVLKTAEIIVVDDRQDCTLFGEVSHGLANNAITPNDIHGELSSLILGNISGRTRPEQITVADLTGLDWQDAVIATLALDKALFLGLGQRLEPGLEQTQLGQRADSLS